MWRQGYGNLNCMLVTPKHLSWWLNPVNILKGRSPPPMSTTKCFKAGVGGMLGNLVTQGKWSLLEKEKYIRWNWKQ